MNQHKDLLYRQKYATYHVFNAKYENFGSLARNQLHIFSGTYCKKKKRGGGKPYYQLLRKIWWLPHPRPPTRALYAKLQREKLHFLSLLTTILKALNYLLKTRELPGAPPPGPPAGALPLHPARDPTAGPWTPPVWGARLRARGALRARIFPPTPFLQILDPPLHIPPCSSKSLAPEASILGELGSSRPPPPMKILGGANISFCPPPPIVSSTWKIDNM